MLSIREEINGGTSKEPEKEKKKKRKTGEKGREVNKKKNLYRVVNCSGNASLSGGGVGDWLVTK